MTKKISIAALILVIGFLAVLFLPTIGWYTLPRPADPNPQKKEPFPDVRKTEIKVYPQKIEEWYNVFMPYHSTLSGLNYKICHLCGIHPVNIVVEGEDGWFFYNYCGFVVDKSHFVDAKSIFETPYHDYIGVNLYSPGQLEKIRENFVHLRDILYSKNIRFIILIVPNKTQIYGDRYYPVGMRRKDPNCMTRAKQVTALLKDAGITVIYPEEDLLQWERDYEMPMYYKTDTHWTRVAGALVSRQILSVVDPAVSRDMIPMTVDSIQWDFGKGDLLKMIHYPGNWNERSPFFSQPSECYEQYSSQKNYYTLPENPDCPNGKKIFLLGDSFGNQMYRTIANYSKQLVRYPYYEINTTEIDKFHPDVVIQETVERLLDRFLLMKETTDVRIPE